MRRHEAHRHALGTLQQGALRLVGRIKNGSSQTSETY